MLTLGQRPPISTGVESPSTLRAFRNQRLSELKRTLGDYYGFTSGQDVASAIALQQATGDFNNRQEETARTPEAGASTVPGDVARNRRFLGVRADTGLSLVFEKLLDPGDGAKKVLDVGEGREATIKEALQSLLRGTNLGTTIETRARQVERCVKIHFHPEAGVSIEPGSNGIFLNDLGGALPVEDPNSFAKKNVVALRLEHPVLAPGEKNAELLSVFFNSMPTLEMTRATPVMNVTIYSSRPAIEGGKLAAITLQKFIEGTSEVSADPTQNVIALGSQVSASLFGQTDQAFENYTVTGIELFRSPQTLINYEAAKDPSLHLAPIIDPTRPLASLKSFTIDVRSAYGLQGTRTATLELVLHDRSRLGDFVDFVKPDRYGTSFLEIEYGWSHPDTLDDNNPFADLLNLTRSREHFNIVSSNFKFDDVGQVNITLSCMGRGASEISELSIVGPGAAGRIQNQIRQIEEISRTINDLAARAFPRPPETVGNAQAQANRREIRGQQGLSAASDATNNLILTRELLTQMRDLRSTLQARARDRGLGRDIQTAATQLQNRITDLIGNTGTNRAPSGNSAVGSLQRSINHEIRNTLNRINSAETNTNQTQLRESRYGDAFLKSIPSDVWSKLVSSQQGQPIDNEHFDGVRVEDAVVGQLASPNTPSGGNNAAGALNRTVEQWSGKKVVSLGTLISAFVAKPLAEMTAGPTEPRFDEVQLWFYNFNNKASLMSRCNISQFPVNVKYFIREYSRLRMENAGRTINLSVAEFMNFLSTRIVDDVMNPAYKISDLYRRNQNELTAANPRNFDQQMLARMRANNIGRHTDFTMPQLTFDLEAVPAVIGAGEGDLQGSVENGRGKTILKIHIYDKACSPNSSFRELLSLSTNNLMATLSPFPGDDTQRVANESSAVEGVRSAQRQNEIRDELRNNWRELHQGVVREASSRGLIALVNPLSMSQDASPEARREATVEQWRFVGGPQRLKELVMKNVPHIIYGCMGTTIKSSELSTMSDPALNTINMQRSLNANPILPNGEQPGGVPLSIYPVELSMTSLGCPMLRYGQELFIDFNTNTTADNIYYITGLTHKFEGGSFDSTIKLTANDAFGQYRNLIGQLNVGARTIAHIPRAAENPPRR